MKTPAFINSSLPSQGAHRGKALGKEYFSRRNTGSWLYFCEPNTVNCSLHLLRQLFLLLLFFEGLLSAGRRSCKDEGHHCVSRPLWSNMGRGHW